MLDSEELLMAVAYKMLGFEVEAVTGVKGKQQWRRDWFKAT